MAKPDGFFQPKTFRTFTVSADDPKLRLPELHTDFSSRVMRYHCHLFRARCKSLFSYAVQCPGQLEACGRWSWRLARAPDAASLRQCIGLTFFASVSRVVTWTSRRWSCAACVIVGPMQMPSALGRPPVLGSAVRQCAHWLRVMHADRCDKGRRHQAQQACEHMTLDGLYFLCHRRRAGLLAAHDAHNRQQGYVPL